MHALATLIQLTFPVLVIVAALKDLTSYTIPNWISLALIAVFPLAALAQGLTIGAIGLQVAVGAIALMVGMGMFAAGWIGGGDAKLLGAAGLWIGWPAAMTYILVTGVAGGVLAMALLGLRSPALKPHMPSGPGWLARLAQPGENVPYGVAIALGALAAFPISPLVAGR
ncbi:MAG: prepilin peptidase [Phenylobacterium sp.]